MKYLDNSKSKKQAVLERNQDRDVLSTMNGIELNLHMSTYRRLPLHGINILYIPKLIQNYNWKEVSQWWLSIE